MFNDVASLIGSFISAPRLSFKARKHVDRPQKPEMNTKTATTAESERPTLHVSEKKCGNHTRMLISRSDMRSNLWQDFFSKMKKMSTPPRRPGQLKAPFFTATHLGEPPLVAFLSGQENPGCRLGSHMTSRCVQGLCSRINGCCNFYRCLDTSTKYIQISPAPLESGFGRVPQNWRHL